jgi:fructose/tagatose bisphosphate aldolase
MLGSSVELLQHARQKQTFIPAFNVYNLEIVINVNMEVALAGSRTIREMFTEKDSTNPRLESLMEAAQQAMVRVMEGFWPGRA